MQWRLLDTGPAPGEWNMALDEALMMSQSRGEAPPTLRFYAWNPPAVSTGYFQNIEKEIDAAACAARGISVVRRPTGGRAILHDREVTYSVSARPDNPLVAGTVMESYLKISRCLIAGLAELGITAELSATDVRRHKSTACFDAPSRYELVADGRKLIGSAQARKYNAALQHGSIPLEIDPDQLCAVIRFADEQERKRYRNRLVARAISLNEAGGRRYHYDEVVQALCRGFARAGGLELQPGELTPWEAETARQLARDKYGGGTS